MGLYSDYQTSPEAEVEGINVEFGSPSEPDYFYMKCARAGGANKAFAKVMERRMRPHRHAIDTDKLSEETASEVLKRVYAETIVKNWGGPGLVDKDGQSMGPCTPENVFKVFSDLDTVFDRVRKTVTSANRYLVSELEADAKN